MTKNSIHLPKFVPEGRSIAISWLAFLCKVLGDNAFVSKELLSMVDFFLTQKVLFEELQALDQAFMTKVLYFLDLRFEEMCNASQRGEMNPIAPNYNIICKLTLAIGE